MKTYTVTIALRVQDERQLYEAAYRRACENASKDDARDMLTYEDGSPNISNCLITLLEPSLLDGCEILSSDAENVE